MNMIIYKVTNLINGKCYIGQTSRKLEVRWKAHLGSSHCTALHNAILKYGKDSFMVEQIDSAETQEELNEKEIYWIKFYNSLSPNGYNLSIGGNICGMVGAHHSAESKRKISESNKGRKMPDHVKQKISIVNKGNKNASGKRTEEQRKRISDATKAAMNRKEVKEKLHSPVSEKTKQKISNSLTGKKLTSDHRKAISEGLKRRWSQNA